MNRVHKNFHAEWNRLVAHGWMDSSWHNDERDSLYFPYYYKGILVTHLKIYFPDEADGPFGFSIEPTIDEDYFDIPDELELYYAYSFETSGEIAPFWDLYYTIFQEGAEKFAKSQKPLTL